MPGPTIWAMTADASQLDAETRAALAADLLADGETAGRLLLTTCHRVELYGRGPVPRRFTDPPVGSSGPRLLRDRDAVRHLLRVAAGLESAVVGEDQILAQLRMATQSLRADPRRDPVVDRLAQTALGVGRRVRRGGRPREAGLAERALGWLLRRMAVGARPRLLVVGAGAMGRSVAFVARRRGLQVTIATRTPRRLFDGLEAIDLAAAVVRVGSHDGIVIALAGPWTAAEDAPADGFPPVVDLSSPGALPPHLAVRLADQGTGYVGIDDLFGHGSASRPSTAGGTFATRAAAESESAARAFETWLGARSAAAAARRLVARSARRRDARVERALRKLPELDDRGRDLVRQLAVQVAADVLHEPLTHLGRDGDGRAREAASRLFDL